MKDLKELREDINKLGTGMKDMLAKAREEKRELTAEEKISFDKMDADRSEAQASERRQLAVEEQENKQDERRAQHTAPERRPESRQEISSDDRSNAMRAWLQAGSDKPLSPEQMALCARMGVNPQSKTFKMQLGAQTPKVYGYSDTRMVNNVPEFEKRALSTLTGTSPEDGSYLIPNEMIGPLEVALLEFGGVRQAATVRRTSSGANYPIPTMDDTSNKGYLLAENTITVKKDLAFGQLVLNAFKFSSKEVLVSLELMQDSNENLNDVIGAALGERIGRIQNDYYTTGTGSSEPKGIVTAATNSSVTFAAKTPTYAELVGIEHAVDPRYRNGAAWMFHDTFFAEVKKMVDASTGRPIWLPTMVAGAPDTILGYPYFINQSMAVAASTGSGKSALFGALKKYIVRDVRDITLFRLDELYAEYFQVAFVAFARGDGDLLDAGTHPVVYASNHS